MLNEKLINPRSIVVVGGSNSLSKPGGALVRNITRSGFAGKLYAINPGHTTVQGVPCVDLNAAEFPVIDLAILAVPAAQVYDAMDGLIKKGVKAFIVCSSGFSEMSEEGKVLEQKIAGLSSDAGACLIGPNCIGAITCNYSGVFAGHTPRLSPKGVDFASGSGATAMYTIERAVEMGIPFASMLSLGNCAQVGIEQVLKYWDETYDPRTSSRVKMLYFEKIENPALLMKHASSLYRKGCVIAAVKSGGSVDGARAASSHTGALATNDVVVDALFRRAGMIRCHSREELITTAGILLIGKPKGEHIAIVTQAGGPGILATDALSQGGLKVPRLPETLCATLKGGLDMGSATANPIDFMATGTEQQIKFIIEHVEKHDDLIDGMIFIFGDVEFYDVSGVYSLLVGRPETGSIPIYPILPTMVTSREKLDRYREMGGIFFVDEVLVAEALVRIVAARPPMEGISLSTVALDKSAQGTSSTSGFIDPDQVSKLLSGVNIPCARQHLVTDATEAVQAAQELTYPLVMKVVGPVHKTDVGGVAIGINNDDDVRTTFRHMMAISGAHAVMLQQQKKGIELFVGAKYEQGFGHLIFCGLGGIYIEIFKDNSSRLAPLLKDDALEMISSLRSLPLLQGYRGQPGADITKFAEIVVRLSTLLDEKPEISEIDLNPIMAMGSEFAVVDARIKVGR